MNAIGFGTYRTYNSNIDHFDALVHALHRGIRIIDTSANYTDGESEQLIGRVLHHVRSTINSNEIRIISKVGYIQGKTLLNVKQGHEVHDLVCYSDECYHSIHPDFIDDQLTQSLARLGLETIDTYLLHNPEYYLFNAIGNDRDKKNDAQNVLLERIKRAFVQCEREVRIGRIHRYGISSNSFSLPEDELYYLPYVSLLDLATKAATEVGNVKHSFATIELPINILEIEGLKCASWAKANGLEVIVNRPLNANKHGVMYRLAEYEYSANYEESMNVLLYTLENISLQSLANLVHELDAIKHRFRWIGEYEEFLYRTVLPHIKNVLLTINMTMQEQIINQIDFFLNAYREVVAYEMAKRTKIELSAYFHDKSRTMQDVAINFLVQHKDVDIVLIGMRKVKYVEDIISFIKNTERV